MGCISRPYFRGNCQKQSFEFFTKTIVFLTRRRPKVQQKMHICKKNLFFLPSTLLYPTHLPLVSHLSPLEPHWNFIGTSPYLYRKTPLISSTFHLPFSYKKRTFFKVRFFIHTMQTPTIPSPPYHFPRLIQTFLQFLESFHPRYAQHF